MGQDVHHDMQIDIGDANRKQSHIRGGWGGSAGGQTCVARLQPKQPWEE